MYKRFLKTVELVEASDVLTMEELDLVADSGHITFGDANRTLVTAERIIKELGFTPSGLEGCDRYLYVDLEN